VTRRPIGKVAFRAAIIGAAFGAMITDQRALAGPSCGNASQVSPSTVSGGEVGRKFAQFYRAWHRQSEAIQFSSNTRDYIALPAYRGIVGLGRPAVPLLAKTLVHDRDGDFMLAHAVMEICGWDSQGFDSNSEQALRDKVLRRLGGSE
jgi:hypothetical protein